jgi:hypothetical protein
VTNIVVEPVPGPVQSYTFPDLPAGDHRFRVRALFPDGVVGEWSHVLEAAGEVLGTAGVSVTAGLPMPTVVAELAAAGLPAQVAVEAGLPMPTVTAEVEGALMAAQVAVEAGLPMPTVTAEVQGDAGALFYFLDMADEDPAGTGVLPPNWTNRWGSALWSLSSLSWTLTEFGSGAGPVLATWDLPGEFADGEVFQVVSATQPNGDPTVRLRATGASGSERDYHLQVTSSEVRLRKYDTAGTLVTLATLAFVRPVEVECAVRLRADGDVIKAKVWRWADPEPWSGGPDGDGYQLKATDSDHASGRVGSGRTQTSGQKRTHRIGVAVGTGALAPTGPVGVGRVTVAAGLPMPTVTAEVEGALMAAQVAVEAGLPMPTVTAEVQGAAAPAEVTIAAGLPLPTVAAEVEGDTGVDLYFLSFTDEPDTATGVLPPNWTRRWGTGSWRIFNGFLQLAGVTNVREFASWDVPGEFSDGEVLASVHTSSVSNNQNAVRIRCTGESGSERGYYVELFGGTAVQLRKYTSDGAIILATLSVSWNTATFYRLRIRADGNVIKAKFWQTTEPTTGGPDDDGYQLKAIDDDFATGRAGLGGFTGVGTKRFGRIGVAVGTGGIAPAE